MQRRAKTSTSTPYKSFFEDRFSPSSSPATHCNSIFRPRFLSMLKLPRWLHYILSIPPPPTSHYALLFSLLLASYPQLPSCPQLSFPPTYSTRLLPRGKSEKQFLETSWKHPGNISEITGVKSEVSEHIGNSGYPSITIYKHSERA